MEVVVTAGAIGRAKLQSNHHHQQTSTKSFLQAGCPSCHQTTVSEHWRENITFHELAYPKLTWGLPTLSRPLKAPGYRGEVCHASHQPFDVSTPSLMQVQYMKRNCATKGGSELHVPWTCSPQGHLQTAQHLHTYRSNASSGVFGSSTLHFDY